jgi:hypothetical protein
MTMRHWRTAGLLALSFALSGCGESTEPPASTEASVSSRATAGEEPGLDGLPEKNIAGLDVCVALPGDAVARAVESTFVEALALPVGHGCKYLLGSTKLQVSVAVRDRMTYESVRTLAESFDKPVDDVSSLGVAAYTKESADHERQLYVVRGDGLYLMVQASDQAWVDVVAQLALDTIP